MLSHLLVHCPTLGRNWQYIWMKVKKIFIALLLSWAPSQGLAGSWYLLLPQQPLAMQQDS